MKYFQHTKLREIKNISQNKTKQIGERGKDKVWKGIERGFGVLVWGNFFCYFF